MCQFFKFNEDSKIIGECSKIEQHVLCCGDRTECECKESFEDSVFEETQIEKSNKTLAEVVEEMRSDLADIKIATTELLKLIRQSDDDTELVNIIENMGKVSNISKRFDEVVTND